eukprot:g8528.t1
MFALVLSLVVEILEAQRIYEVLASDRRPGEGTYPLSQIIQMWCDNFQTGEEYSEDVVAIWCPATGWRVANSMEDCVKSWLEPMSSVHSAAACDLPHTDGISDNGSLSILEDMCCTTYPMIRTLRAMT